MKFIHLSPTTDFSSELQSQLRIINGNVLYLTREIDKISNTVKIILDNLNLQKQVDDYFDKGEAHLLSETSPQTDSDEQ